VDRPHRHEEEPERDDDQGAIDDHAFQAAQAGVRLEQQAQADAAEEHQRARGLGIQPKPAFDAGQAASDREPDERAQQQGCPLAAAAGRLRPGGAHGDRRQGLERLHRALRAPLHERVDQQDVDEDHRVEREHPEPRAHRLAASALRVGGQPEQQGERKREHGDEREVARAEEAIEPGQQGRVFGLHRPGWAAAEPSGDFTSSRRNSMKAS
jgi:hypothetical protein